MWKLQCKGSLEPLFHTDVSFYYKITSPALFSRFETAMDTTPLLCSKTLQVKKKYNFLYHRMAWVEISLKHHLVPTLLSQEGTPSTRPGCSKTHPTNPENTPREWKGTPFLCITILIMKNFFLTSDVVLFYFKVITPCPKKSFTISSLGALFLLITLTETPNLLHHLN